MHPESAESSPTVSTLSDVSGMDNSLSLAEIDRIIGNLIGKDGQAPNRTTMSGALPGGRRLPRKGCPPMPRSRRAANGPGACGANQLHPLPPRPGAAVPGSRRRLFRIRCRPDSQRRPDVSVSKGLGRSGVVGE